jgi:hypothetical protein
MSGLLMTRKQKPGPSDRHGIDAEYSTKRYSLHNGTLRKRAKQNLSSPSGLMPLYGIRPAYAGSALPGFIHKKVTMKLMIESSHKLLFKISIQEARLKNK